MSAKAFNGHHCWNCWNVALWLTGSDEGLYRMAMDYAKRSDRRAAAQAFVDALAEIHVARTPDGARYTMTSVRHALAGLVS